jgi:hypothetical protein
MMMTPSREQTYRKASSFTDYCPMLSVGKGSVQGTSWVRAMPLTLHLQMHSYIRNADADAGKWLTHR